MSADPVRQALFELLSGDGTLTDLLSSPEAVYHRVAVGADPPYLIYHRHSGVALATFGASTERAVWLVKGVCRGNSSTAAEEIDGRCQLLLDQVQLEVAEGGRPISVIREGAVDYGEVADNDQWHHVGSLYRVFT